MAYNALLSRQILTAERVERLLHVGTWRVDLQTNKLHWSEEVFAIHGISSAVYEPDIITAIDAYVPEDRKMVSACIEHAIERGESFMFQARIVHGSGNIRVVLSKGEPIKDKNGNVTGLEGTFQDITEYIEEQDRFERAALGSGTAIWDWDIQSDQVHWLSHSYRSLGYIDERSAPSTSEEFFTQLVHEDHELAFKHAIDEHLKEKTEFAINVQVYKADKTPLWVVVRGQAQWDSQGQAFRLSGSFTDIQALKGTEQKLLRSNDDLEQFASVAAHDLQQPLRTISGFLEIVEKEEAEKLSDKSKEYIRTSIESAESMSELVNDLLEYSRLETEGLHREEVDTTKIIQEAIRPIKQAIIETGAAVHFDGMPTLRCDRYKMQRVFTNIIDNAIKYKKPGEAPIINITAQKIDRMWVFSIADNGIGMDKKNIEDIFLMFNRLHNDSKEFDGTGIGLSISKKIIDLHGGNIWAESKKGTGSVFHFEIPC